MITLTFSVMKRENKNLPANQRENEGKNKFLENFEFEVESVNRRKN